jgi:polysaccharide export outer membrane protein
MHILQSRRSRPIRLSLLLLAALSVAACETTRMPRAGPHTDEVLAATMPNAAVQVVDVSPDVARRLVASRKQVQFSETFGDAPPREASTLIGAGDVLDITLWEAPPATLFGVGPVDPRTPSTLRAMTLPEQVVDRDGAVRVPFAGPVKVLGRTVPQVQDEIVQRLRGKANQPEALVRIVRNGSAMVTVVGEVATSVRMPLTPGGERLLDALAAAGGVRQPVHRTTVQMTRGSEHHAMPLDTVIRDPRQNVPLRGGDVITAIHQPLYFVALGATGKNEEIPFEAQGITLSQAIARAGGLNDSRTDPKGVFVFRFESADAIEWPTRPVQATAEGKVPVVYRVNLDNANNFFVMQSFPIRDRDIVYVSNAPAVELQKFLNLVFTLTYPVLNTYQIFR